MSGSVNKCILLGHLGQDPEVRVMTNGERVVTLRLATSERWKDKATGTQKERTDWHTVVIFNEDIGKIAESYLKKGSKCYLEGAQQTRKWTDKNNIERYNTEAVLKRFRGVLLLLDGASGSRPPPADESDYDGYPQESDYA